MGIIHPTPSLTEFSGVAYRVTYLVAEQHTSEHVELFKVDLSAAGIRVQPVEDHYHHLVCPRVSRMTHEVIELDIYDQNKKLT